MTTVYSRHPDLRVTAVDGEGVVLHLGSRQYFSVNETGVTILDALKQPSSIAELVVAVTDHYDVSADAAEQSVRRFLALCNESKLLHVEER